LLISCWSAKGGVGTTVVAASLGLVLGKRSPGGAVLADLAGDLPLVLGLRDLAPDGPGLAGWLAAGAAVPADALGRLELPVAAGLGLLPRGAGPLPGARAEVLVALLESGNRPVVADCGVLRRRDGLDDGEGGDAAEAVARAATRSLLVTRPCYLALERARRLAWPPSGVVLVREPGHRCGRADVEQAAGAPVVAVVESDPDVSRAVDSGLLADRLPGSLVRGLRNAA
jgi:MinD-like ATPase involved in chromosome partitioning or flagellar assembly